MTKKEIYLLVHSDYHQTINKSNIIGIATKQVDAQKLYSKALKDLHIVEKDATQSDCLAVYQSETGEVTSNILNESTKLWSSNGN